MSEWKTIVEGCRIILQALRRLFARLKEKCRRRRPGQRDYKDIRCLTPPNRICARPDPCVYSQTWLRSRNLAFVWDNPDFRLIDVATDLAVGSHDLLPDKDYDVEVTVHNNSFMAAIGVHARFEVRRFGAGTGIVEDLGSVVVNVPGMGTALARRRWHTPPSGGQACLRAILHHPEDANPLNNVGQHNTDVAVPASPARRIRFLIGNDGATTRPVRLVMDSYRLPEGVKCPDSFRVRNSLAYLRGLQQRHDVRRFPVPEYLKARLSPADPQVPPAAEVEVTLELEPPPRGSGTHSVNVNAYYAGALLGGITAYVSEEGES